jgi:hypothetical protein
MAATVGSLFATQQNRITEVINKDVDVILPGLDPVWMDTIVTSQNVGPADAIGRDMRIVRVFQGGLTGVISQGKPADDFPLFGDDQDLVFGSRLHTQGLANTFPNPMSGANQTPYTLIVPMRCMLTNIMFTLGELTAEALPAFIGEVIAPKWEGFATHMGQQLCTYFWANQNKSYQLSGVGLTASHVVDDSGATNFLTFSPDNEATDRFMQGMAVDLFSSDGATKRNGTNLVFVYSVDELTNKVTLGSRAQAFTALLSNNDIVVWRNQADATPTHTALAGINSWLKDGTNGLLANPPVVGTGNDLILLGAEAEGSVGAGKIDISVFPEHKSMGYSLRGQILTEHVLRQVLRRFHAAKGKYGYSIDCLIASDGVWLAHEQSKIGRERIDRTNRIGGMSPSGYQSTESFGGFQFTMDGRTYMGYTSTYVEDGTVYGLKKGGGNWKRYVPPDIRMSKPFDKGKAARFAPFRFVAPSLTGLGSIQVPIQVTGGGANDPTLITEGAQIPGWMRMQLVPDQFSMLRIANCQTDKIYADF